jgi:hypothetical protein
MKTVQPIKWLLFSLAALAIASCRKEIDNPPQNEIPVSAQLDVTELRAIYTGTPIHFEDGDTNLYCVVTADEVSGNLYKNVYVTDGTSGLNVRLFAAGGLYEGDSIRINLNGTILSEYNGMLQLDSVDVDKNVVKIATNVAITPRNATVDEVIADPSLQGMLVKLSNVEFSNTDVGTTFANATTQSSKNVTVLDCGGSSVIMRTSGYSNFASSIIPSGNGTIVAVVGQYNLDKQLYLRRTSDISLPNASCQPTIYLNKNFEDQNVTSGGWTVKMVTGAVNWTTNTQGAQFGTAYGMISNYSGGANSACESWLISPAMNMTGAAAPKFSFQNAKNDNGDVLTVWVSTNYDGVSAPSTATWTQLTVTLSAGAWSWVNSGLIDMTPYISGSTYVAFKYTGTASSGSTWEIDDILIED